jgi:anti-anti-sigma factor
MKNLEPIAKFLPFLRWFPLSGSQLRADVFAGVTVALVLIPQSMAYAQLAGLPVVYGLYAAFIPSIIAALWGSFRQLHTGPVAMLALMSAAAILPLAAQGSEHFIELSIMLALMVGVLRLLLGLLQLGVIVNFLSQPVIVGFTNAAALIIGLSQLSQILGVPAPRTESFLYDLWVVLSQLAEAHWPTFLFGLGTWAFIMLMRRYLPKWPNILLAVVLAILVSHFIGFEQKATVQPQDIVDAEVQTLVNQYIENYKKITEHKEEAQALQTKQRLLTDPIDRLRLQKEAEVLQARAQVLSLENNELQIKLHKIPLMAYAKGGYGRHTDTDQPIWRIKRISSSGLGLSAGGAVIGTIPQGLPALTLPHFDPNYFWVLFPSALLMALIGFMEATSISKAISAKTRQKINTNQELIGQGLANIIGSFFQSFTVSGSFSRSALAASSGAQTGIFTIVAAAFVVITILYLTPFLYALPNAVLAVIVMVAVFGLINFQTLWRAWKIRKLEAVTGLLTFVATLWMAPNLANGILVGAGFAILVFLKDRLYPNVQILGRHPDGTLGSMEVHGLEKLSEAFLAVRFDGSLTFLNAAHFEDNILNLLAKNPNIQAILIVGSAINDIDSSGVEKIVFLQKRLAENGVTLAFSSLKSPIFQTLKQAGLLEAIGEDNIFKSKEQAIATLSERYAAR